jgi:hypothetical protein
MNYSFFLSACAGLLCLVSGCLSSTTIHRLPQVPDVNGTSRVSALAGPQILGVAARLAPTNYQNFHSITALAGGKIFGIQQNSLFVEYGSTFPFHVAALAPPNGTLELDYSWFNESPSIINDWQTESHGSCELIGISQVRETASWKLLKAVSSATQEYIKQDVKAAIINWQFFIQVWIHVYMAWIFAYLNSTYLDQICVRSLKHLRLYYPLWIFGFLCFMFNPLWFIIAVINCSLLTTLFVATAHCFLSAYCFPRWLSFWSMIMMCPPTLRYVKVNAFSFESRKDVMNLFTLLFCYMFLYLTLKQVARLTKLLKKIVVSKQYVETQSGGDDERFRPWDRLLRTWKNKTTNSQPEEVWDRFAEYCQIFAVMPRDVRFSMMDREWRHLFMRYATKYSIPVSELSDLFYAHTYGMNWTEDDFMDPQDFYYSFVGLESMSFKIDDISAARLEQEAPLHSPSIDRFYLFPNTRWKGVRVPDWLQDMTTTAAYGIALNISKCGFIPPSRSQYHEAKEIQAQCRFAIKQDGCSALRDVLLRIYKSDTTDLNFVQTLPSKWIRDTNAIRMQVSQKLTSEDDNRRGHKAATAMRISIPGPLYQWISDSPYSKQMWRWKIKSMIKSMLKNDVDHALILERIVKHLTIPKAGDIHIDGWKGAEWAIPFIPPMLLYLDVNNLLHYQSLIKQSLVELRKDLIRYVKEYLIVSQMSDADRKAIAARRIAMFVDRMRAPSAQRDFLQFGPEYTTDKIYHEACNDVRHSIVRDPIVRRHQHVQRAHIRKQRARDRDIKFAKTHSFEMQSMQHLDVFMSIMITISLFLLSLVAAFRTLKQYILGVSHVQSEIAASARSVQTSLDHATSAFNNATVAMNRVVADPVVTSAIDAVNNARTVRTEMESTMTMLRRFLTEEDYELPPHLSINMTGVKTAIHFLYHLYRGEKELAMGWLTNYVFLYPKTIKNSIISLGSSLDFSAFARYALEPKATINYRGQALTVNSRQFQELVNLHEAGSDVSEFIQRVHTPVELQSGIDFVGALASLVATLKIPNMSASDVRELNQQFTFVKNVSTSAQGGMAFITSIVSVLCRHFFAWDPFSPSYCAFVNDIINHVRFVNTAEMERARIPSNLQLMQEILRRNAHVQEMLNHPLMAAIPSYTAVRFRDRARLLEELAAIANSTIGNAHMRATPTSVLFIGEPGIGKSAATLYIMKHICYFMGFEFTADKVYNYNGASEYWEGYAQQLFVVMDDLFKAADKMTRMNEASVIISMINTATYALNMAFEGKGFSFFNSKFVLMSTNIANDGLHHAQFEVGLTDPKALLRRFHLVLHRSEKLDRDVEQVSFKIEACKFFPHLVGTQIATDRVPALMMAISRKHEEELNTHEYEHSHFAEKYGGRDPKVVLDEQIAEFGIFGPQQFNGDIHQRFANVEIQSGRPQRKIMSGDATMSEVMGAMLELHLLSWWDSDWTYFYITLFSAATMCTSAYFMYQFFCPTEKTTLVDVEANGSSSSGTDSWVTKVMLRGVANVKKRKYRGRADFKGAKLASSSARIHIKRGLLAKGKLHLQSDSINYLKSVNQTLSKSVVLMAAEAFDEQGNELYSETSHAIHIKDGIFCAPAHFIMRFDEYETVNMLGSWGGKLYEWTYPDMTVGVEREDLVYFKISGVDLPPPCFKYLMDEEVSEKSIDPGTEMYLISLSTTTHRPYLNRLVRGPFETVAYDWSHGTFLVRQAITYFGETQQGQSGSMICIEGAQGKAHVVGMHVGRKLESDGKTKTAVAIAVPITQKHFNDLSDELSQITSCKATKFDEVEIVDFVDKVGVESIGFQTESFPLLVKEKLPEGTGFRPAARTRIKKNTQMFEFRMKYENGEQYKARDKPAKLHKFPHKETGEMLDPMMIALKKIHQVPTPPCNFNKERLKQWLFKLYPKKQSTYIPTMYESLRGIPERHIQGICVGTSAGFPDCKNGTAGKLHLLEPFEDFYTFKTEILQRLEDKWNALMRGECFPVYWADTLKDEKRPIEKADAGKTRMFSTCNFDFLIIFRRLTLDFTAFVQSTPADKPVSVGINAHSLDWKILFDRLMSCAHSIIA